MNIKHVSLFTVMLISGFTTGIQADQKKVRTVNKEVIKELYEISKREYQVAYNKAEKNPLFDTFSTAEDQCHEQPRHQGKWLNSSECSKFKQIAAEWFKTSEGENLKRKHLHVQGLDRIASYIGTGPSYKDEICDVAMAIHSSVYAGGAGSITPCDKPIRDQAAKELCSIVAIASNVSSQEIEQELANYLEKQKPHDSSCWSFGR